MYWEKYGNYLLWEDDSHECWCITRLARSLREIRILWCQFWRPIKKKKKRESRLSCYELAFAIIQAIFRSLQIFQISAMRNSSQHRKVFICYKIASWKNEQWVGLKIFEIPLNYYFCWKIFIPRKGKLMEEKYYNIILDSSISEGTKCNQQFALAIFLKYDQS